MLVVVLLLSLLTCCFIDLMKMVLWIVVVDVYCIAHHSLQVDVGYIERHSGVDVFPGQ